MARCKRSSALRAYAVPAGGTVDVVLSVDTVEYTLRVVDVNNAGLAFTLAYADNPTVLFHFAAGEGYQEERIGGPNPLPAPLTLRIGAAAAGRAELVVWDG